MSRRPPAHPGPPDQRPSDRLSAGRAPRGAVVRRDPHSGPPEAPFSEEWQGRLRTLLAKAAAQGLPADEAHQRAGGSWTMNLGHPAARTFLAVVILIALLSATGTVF